MKPSFLGILIVLISLFFLKVKLNVYKVEAYGKIVDMKIVKIPTSCKLTKSKYYMNVEYNGMTFIKRIPVNFCNSHNVGSIVKVKYLEGEETILFPDEEIWGEFVAIGFFLFAGIILLLFGFFLKNSPNNASNLRSINSAARNSHS